jgi:hypothetical protein
LTGALAESDSICNGIAKYGQISAEKSQDGLVYFRGYLDRSKDQTDGFLNPKNSGPPLFRSLEALVGFPGQKRVKK